VIRGRSIVRIHSGDDIRGTGGECERHLHVLSIILHLESICHPHVT